MSCWSVLEADLMVDDKVGLGLGFDVEEEFEVRVGGWDLCEGS